MKPYILILSIWLICISNSITASGIIEILYQYQESLYAGHYNQTVNALNLLEKNYKDHVQTNLAFANYLLMRYETEENNEKYAALCKNYCDRAVESIQKNKKLGYDEVFHLISAKAILLKIKVNNKNYLAAAKDMKEFMNFFEFALNNEENEKMKVIAGMYNYHIENAKDDYPIIYPVVIFYPKGNKQKGIKQLIECTSIPDKTISIRSKWYLAQIYKNDEKIFSQSKYWFEKLLIEYPDNLIWRKEYINCLKRFNKTEEADTQIKILTDKVKSSEHINNEQKKFFLSIKN